MKQNLGLIVLFIGLVAMLILAKLKSPRPNHLSDLPDPPIDARAFVSLTNYVIHGAEWASTQAFPNTFLITNYVTNTISTFEPAQTLKR